ncbi:hypothetical protein BE17_23780 [Sorangium cellulosum]|uniref:Uncharacterized protein n=1 Tax=Sorangium cellulosum TaxID=56 RepID=A0A150R9C1_SORCE|nr:hypothetical protein BE17_23780 [Sorangium cellulosum]
MRAEVDVMRKQRKPGVTRQQEDPVAADMIVEERVVSEPGAAMRVTELVLTPEAERELTITATKLGKVR